MKMQHFEIEEFDMGGDAVWKTVHFTVCEPCGKKFLGDLIERRQRFKHYWRYSQEPCNQCGLVKTEPVSIMQSITPTW